MESIRNTAREQGRKGVEGQDNLRTKSNSSQEVHSGMKKTQWSCELVNEFNSLKTDYEEI